MLAQLEMFPNLKQSTLSLSDSLAKIYQLLAKDEVLKAQEVACSMRQSGLLENCNLHILSLKMSRVCLPITGGADFTRCLREIADIGLYDCEWQLVNTSWVLPQNRERIYFIGHLRGKSQPKVFPFTESCFKSSQKHGIKIFGSTKPEGCSWNRNKDVVCDESGICRCLTASDDKQPPQVAHLAHSIKEKTKGNPQGNRINTIYGNSVTLQSQSGGQGAKTGLYVVPVLTPTREEKRQNGRRFKEDGDPMFTLTTQDQHGVMIVKEATTKGFVEVPANCGVDLTQPNSKTRRGRLMNKNCSTLTTQSNGLAWFDGISIRRLTPVECLRLQGFPDDWYGEGFSDSSIYKGCGNAVSTLIVKIIATYKGCGNAVSTLIVKIIATRLFKDCGVA